MKPINRVSVVSSSTVRICPQHAETDGTPLLCWLNTSRRWTDRRPINVYVIEHDRGLVQFGTGQDRRSVPIRRTFPAVWPDIYRLPLGTRRVLWRCCCAARSCRR
jgi:N-acyl homoserine lactone hydrolase